MSHCFPSHFIWRRRIGKEALNLPLLHSLSYPAGNKRAFSSGSAPRTKQLHSQNGGSSMGMGCRHQQHYQRHCLPSCCLAPTESPGSGKRQIQPQLRQCKPRLGNDTRFLLSRHHCACREAASFQPVYICPHFEKYQFCPPFIYQNVSKHAISVRVHPTSEKELHCQPGNNTYRY